MTDGELLELLRAEPERGLAEVLDTYSAYVYKIAYSKLGSVCSKEDIEEAVSDIFLMFYEYGRKKGFELPSVGAYLSVIAKRRSINLYKKLITKSETVSLDEIEDYVGESAAADSRRREIIETIKQLGEPDSEIILRRYFIGQKSREIAGDLGLKQNTVDKKISRGLKKLKEILEKEGM